MDAKPNFTEGSKNITLALRTELFKHEPLDHTKASIRLLQIRADLSRDGLIQCSLRHTTISSTPYSCLSYRWGEPLPSWKILINGKPYHVGRNLYDFLDTFRQSTLNQATENIWIDAMCIAQNDVLERNHQVTQMGEIFSTAKSVYVWLGRMPSIAPVVRGLKDWQNATCEDIGIICCGDILSRYLYNNEYWNRAWITQEFLLARHIIVFLDNEPLDLSDLLSNMESYYLLIENSYKSSSFSRHVDFYQKATDIAGLPLLSVLGRFREKRCSLLQDRIFSVLSLCLPSSRVTVDYDQDPVLLACTVLANSPAPLCLCEVMTLLRDLDLLVDPATEILEVADPRHQAWEGMYVDVDLDRVQLPRTLPCRDLDSPGRLFIRNHTICPVIEEVIMSCARKARDSPSIIDRELANSIPAQNIPYILRQMDQELKLDLAQKMCQSGSSVFTIETAHPRSPQYTLRIPMHSMVNTRVEPHDHCPKIYRGPTRYDRCSKYQINEKDFNLFRKRWSNPDHFYLKSEISFKDCCTVYELLVERDEIPDIWGVHLEVTIDPFLEDLSQHLRGEATLIRGKALEEAIEKVDRFVPMASCRAYGPCRFVCLRDSTEDQTECA